MVMTIQAFHHSVPNTTKKDLFSHGMTMVQTRNKTLKLAMFKNYLCQNVGLLNLATRRN